MVKNLLSCLVFTTVLASGFAIAADPVDLAQKFKQLPTVPEDALPPMGNEREDFRGKILAEGLRGHTWVRFPFVENPGSFGFDRKGRLFVAEANRFWLGVPDLRGANEMIRDDFRAVTVEDRLEMYDKFGAHFPPGWFGKVADRIIRLEDRDGNGVADHRTLFSDYFKRPVDGIGFSVLADEDNTVYFTCIPNLWRLTDTDDDGVADDVEALVEGFGVRVSFIGHDLHGITRGPDGKLYFSVGDRGYHVTTPEGEVHPGSGRGAIFRCEPDGSDFEVFCRGLRNPQELVFDDFGNLFTFDNTGDIGDRARMVYALPGTDSGWDMSHQSAHHYAHALDWGEFRPSRSMWVAERMFDTHNEEQPQWVYPPASHVAEGPSGVTFLTGETLPESLRGRFLLSNYRGAPSNSTTLAIGFERKGAGFRSTEVEEVVRGVAASDVELGYDGAIYLCDYGGGWSVNTNGSIQVLESTNSGEREAGEKVARLFARGFDGRPVPELTGFLRHPDRRVRQAAQFALVKKDGGAEALEETARSGKDVVSRVHGIWGLGQLNRLTGAFEDVLIDLAGDGEEEVRANAIRVLGDNRISGARNAVLEKLGNDASLRVRSLAAVALGRIADRGDTEVVDALFQSARANGTGERDIVFRHAILSGLDGAGTVSAAVERAEADSEEERLLAILFLRRKESPELARFLGDASRKNRVETIRAIYDTAAMDTRAGEALVSLADIGGLPETVQRRFVAGNYRLGRDGNARRLVSLAGDARLKSSVRKAALLGLLRWEDTVDTDPVLGHYRPVRPSGRTMTGLGKAIGENLQAFLSKDQAPELVALAMRLAGDSGVQLDAETLVAKAENDALSTEVRIAALNSLLESGAGGGADVVGRLLDARDVEVRAAALTWAYRLGDRDLGDRGVEAIGRGPLPVARAAIEGMAETAPGRWAAIWKHARESLRPELLLDGYLALQKADPEAASAFVAGDPKKVFSLSERGGDPFRGETIYLNQGGCRQCHKIGGEGGVQGPDLTKVASRLTRNEILTSIYDPNAGIAEGYGTTSVTLEDGTVLLGRLASENKKEVTIVAPDGKKSVLSREDIASMTPPISAMPPLGAALPPRDLRDLVAFIARQTGGGQSLEDDASHGDSDEAIAK